MNTSKNYQNPQFEKLTGRELDVLRLMAEGQTNRQIAHSLIISVATVRWYAKQIYPKLDVHNRTAAVARAHELGLLESESTPMVSDDVPELRHNLPTQTTPFIGREKERSQLTSLLVDNTSHLITILAPGGMGKTRLALAVARQQLEFYPDGVFFIPLAALTSADYLVTSIADVLGMHFQAGSQPENQLLDYLRDKRSLLILDNFEHFLEKSALVNKILQSAPKVDILVTSREKLSLSSESVYMIAGMDLPDLETTNNLYESDGVSLFIERAQSAHANFQPATEDLRHIVQICRLTEGMPLAIMLAAAWVDVLSLSEIIAEIQSSIDFLSAEMRDLPQRQWSIRAIFDPTWNRLTEDEQAIFMRFSVFRRGCTREAAQIVTGANLRHLQVFVNKALLQRTANGRYESHELLRQYAEEKLNAQDSKITAYNTHMEFYMEFLNEREFDIKGRRQLIALNEIEADFENVRNAWIWAVQHKHVESIERALECLFWFVIFRNHFQEGESLLRLAREHLDSSTDMSLQSVWGRLQSRYALVIVRGFHERIETISELVEASMRIAKQNRDQAEIAFCLFTLGEISFPPVEQTGAVPFYEQSLRRYQDLDDRFYVVQVISRLSIWYMTNSNGEPIRQGVDLAREIGEKFGVAHCLYALGGLYTSEGDYDQAEIVYRESSRIHRELGDMANVARANSCVGHIALFQHDPGSVRAQSEAEEALKIAMKINHLDGKQYASLVLGLIAATKEDYPACYQLCKENQYLKVHPLRISIADLGLSIATCGLGDYDQARHHILSLLRYAASMPHSWMGKPSLPVSALLLAHDGEAERAVELLSLSSAGPVSLNQFMEKWPIFQRLQLELKRQLGDDVYQVAWDKGQSLDWETVVLELIDKI